MGLADSLEVYKPDIRPSFERQLDSMSADDRSALLAAATDPTWSSAKLREVLLKEGFQVSKEAFANWRRNVTSK